MGDRRDDRWTRRAAWGTLAGLLALAWLAPLLASARPLWAEAVEVARVREARAAARQCLDELQAAEGAAPGSRDALAVATARGNLARIARVKAELEGEPESGFLARFEGATRTAGAGELRALHEHWELATRDGLRRRSGSPAMANLSTGERARLVLVPLVAWLGWCRLRARAPRVGGVAAALCVAVLVALGMAWASHDAPRFLDKQSMARGEHEVVRVAWAPLSFGPNETRLAEAWSPPGWLVSAAPSGVATLPGEPALDDAWRHPLGTDALGRDVLARLLHGAAPTLEIALGAALAALGLGVLLGLAAGWFGGFVDYCVQRAMETLSSLPFLFLAIVVLAATRGNLAPGAALAATIACVAWTPVARIVRALALIERGREHVLAARVAGIPSWRIALVHVLPATTSAALVATAFVAAGAVGVESALSWLGLSTSVPQPTWGGLAAGAGGLGRAWVWLPPSLLVAATATALLLLADEARGATRAGGSGGGGAGA
jgi:peptide/nickel transport system permease protein